MHFLVCGEQDNKTNLNISIYGLLERKSDVVAFE